MSRQVKGLSYLELLQRAYVLAPEELLSHVVEVCNNQSKESNYRTIRAADLLLTACGNTNCSIVHALGLIFDALPEDYQREIFDRQPSQWREFAMAHKEKPTSYNPYRGILTAFPVRPDFTQSWFLAALYGVIQEHDAEDVDRRMRRFYNHKYVFQGYVTDFLRPFRYPEELESGHQTQSSQDMVPVQQDARFPTLGDPTRSLEDIGKVQSMSEQSSHRGNAGRPSPEMDVQARQLANQISSSTHQPKALLLTSEQLFQRAYVLSPSQAFAPLIKELNEKRDRRRPVDVADILWAVMSRLNPEVDSLVHAAAVIFDTLAEDHKEDLFERQPIEYRQWVEHCRRIPDSHLYNPYKRILPGYSKRYGWDSDWLVDRVIDVILDYTKDQTQTFIQGKERVVFQFKNYTDEHLGRPFSGANRSIDKYHGPRGVSPAKMAPQVNAWPILKTQANDLRDLDSALQFLRSMTDSCYNSAGPILDWKRTKMSNLNSQEMSLFREFEELVKQLR